MLESQNQPVFEARVETFLNEHSGMVDTDRIVVKNVGAPISQASVNSLSLFHVRYYDLKGSATVAWGERIA